MTDSNMAIGVVGVVVGFLGNIVIMHSRFKTTGDCDTLRKECATAREQRWEELDKRLETLEDCMRELQRGWKENYKMLCEIKGGLLSNNKPAALFMDGDI